MFVELMIFCEKNIRDPLRKFGLRDMDLGQDYPGAL